MGSERIPPEVTRSALRDALHQEGWQDWMPLDAIPVTQRLHAVHEAGRGVLTDRVWTENQPSCEPHVDEEVSWFSAFLTLARAFDNWANGTLSCGIDVRVVFPVGREFGVPEPITASTLMPDFSEAAFFEFVARLDRGVEEEIVPPPPTIGPSAVDAIRKAEDLGGCRDALLAHVVIPRLKKGWEVQGLG